MSTYWYFECADHDPPLQSDDEISQHTNDSYYQSAVMLAHRRPLFDLDVHASGYFKLNAYRFLRQHPKCVVGLVNEYGQHVPLPTRDEETS